ncbi:hypothetical protein ABNN70_04315 [Sporolactobacillus sp. Y61]|uniref:Uncharacterized protein n=1 Tax=Sporolactobacillus sp. Y61 TaxID=3160863 RepID=A0AAU8IHL1_9BACL
MDQWHVPLLKSTFSLLVFFSTCPERFGTCFSEKLWQKLIDIADRLPEPLFLVLSDAGGSLKAQRWAG